MDYKSIRAVRQQTAEGFSDPAYYGSYGRFVKMNSGMSIEEALLLGEPTVTSIEKLAGGTTRISAIVNGVNPMNEADKVDYNKVTTIRKADIGTIITDELSFGDELLYTKVTTISKDAETGETTIEEEIE